MLKSIKLKLCFVKAPCGSLFFTRMPLRQKKKLNCNKTLLLRDVDFDRLKHLIRTVNPELVDVKQASAYHTYTDRNGNEISILKNCKTHYVFNHIL